MSRLLLLCAALYTCWPAGGVCQPHASEGVGRLQALHNSEGLALETFDVFANGIRLPGADGLSFRKGTPFVDVEDGAQVTVVVRSRTVAADTLAVASYVAESGFDHRVLIEGTREALVARVSRTRAFFILGGGEPRVTIGVHNGSTGIGSFAYDAYATDGSGVVNFGANAGELPVHFSFPAGQYVIRVRLPGFPQRAYSAADFQVPPGETALFFASGSYAVPGAPFGLFVLTDSGAVVSLPLGGVASEPSPLADVMAAWPNPARSGLSVSVGALAAQPGARLEAFDARGRQVWAGPDGLAPGHVVRLEVSVWPAGRYVLRLRGTTGAAQQTSVVVVH